MIVNNPSVNEMLALLDAFKSAVEEGAVREEKLTAETQGAANAELYAFESTRQALDARVVKHHDETETALAREEYRRVGKLQQRANAINRAHTDLKKRAESDANERETRLSQQINTDTSHAEKRRDEQLAAEAVAFQELHQSLAGNEAALEQMQTAARKAFGGFGKFRRWLAPDHRWPESESTPDEQQSAAEFQRLLGKTSGDLGRFRDFFAPKIFRFLPVWLVTVMLLVLAATPFVPLTALHGIPQWVTGASGAALLVIWGFYLLGIRAATPLAREIAGNLFKARRLLDAINEQAGARHAAEQQRIMDECDEAIHALNQDWKQQTKAMPGLRNKHLREIDEKAGRLNEKNEELNRVGLERFKQRQTESVNQLREETRTRLQQLEEAHQTKSAEVKTRSQAQWAALEADWKQTIEPLWLKISYAIAAAEQLFPEWDTQSLEKWTPPPVFRNAAKFARLEVDVAALVEKMPKSPQLPLPCPAKFSLPLTLVFPNQGSVLFKTGQKGGDGAVASINNLIFRLLSTTPPGKLNFTIFDPVGLGQNFAALMHLADYEESSIDSRIWTQTAQFEEKLAGLNEHMEKIIQMYLRNEYATIAEYNAQAGSIAEKYHFLVIASFPANFSDTAMRRLHNIAASGARCGVYTFVQWDQRVATPPSAVLDELQKSSVCLEEDGTGFKFSTGRRHGTRLLLDAPPEPDLATGLLHKAGESSKNSTRVEVPFDLVAPPEAEIWTQNTTEELQVPIGRSGATKLQYLAIGKATRQHALIAGKTGSGKSTLFHVIITNLALWCSPEQVEFYLVDFKKGVEFKCYGSRKLPHARVVAIESDRAFGLSVLQRVDEELRRRGDLFRKVGAQDVEGYRRAGGTEPLPRSLLIIDEFQEFFVEEDRVSQGAAVLLDRIVRQGRAFGIHVLLGSQTLGGAYTLARATMGQMVIRIALQCNEADAYLIMDPENPAPRLLSRPGEGIYNDTAGSIEGNSPFQAVWLSDRERDAALAKVRARADQNPGAYPGPIVFEGNAPADAQENLLLADVLKSTPTTAPAQARAWLGAPNSIKGPTEAVFQRQSANNLLIVGQNEERALLCHAMAMISLAAQYPRGQARFVVLDSSAPGLPQHEFYQRVIGLMPHEVVQANHANLAEVFAGLGEDLKKRMTNEQTTAPELFVLIHGLQNYKQLRAEDEFSFSSKAAEDGPNPAAVLLELLREGPTHGIHVLANCDTYTNANRFLGRKTLGEFEMRVLFQMSAADSASLIDDPAASTLGFYRALLYRDREGSIETFRPYAQPGPDWVESVARELSRR